MLTWNEPNVYPSEPIFVPFPNAKASLNFITILFFNYFVRNNFSLWQNIVESIFAEWRRRCYFVGYYLGAMWWKQSRFISALCENFTRTRQMCVYYTGINSQMSSRLVCFEIKIVSTEYVTFRMLFFTFVNF